MSRYKKQPQGEYLSDWDPMARLYWLHRQQAVTVWLQRAENPGRGGASYRLEAFGQWTTFALVRDAFAEQRAEGLRSHKSTVGQVSLGNLPPPIRHAFAGWIHAHLPAHARVEDFQKTSGMERV